MKKQFFKACLNIFLTGVITAAFCLFIGIITDGDSRSLFITNMLVFALAGYLLKSRLPSVPLVLGIVLLTIPYALYYSTQIVVTPRIIIFPIFNVLGILFGYYFNELVSNVKRPVKILNYIFLITILGWFLIPKVSAWISINEINKKSPPFEVISHSGERINSKDLEDKIVIIDFWATWCAPCIAEFKELEKVQSQFKDNPDVVLLVVNEDNGGDLELSKKFATKRSFNLPYYVDSLGVTYKAFEANAYPALYVIDKKSNIRLVKSGFNPSEDLLQILTDKIHEIDK